MGDCAICCEKYNKTTRKQVVCMFCDKDACRECIITNINSSGTTEKKHCLHCFAEWNSMFLFNNFTKPQIDNTFKKIKNENHIEREISLLPQTQELALKFLDLEKKKRSAEELLKEITEKRAKLNEINLDIERLRDDIEEEIRTGDSKSTSGFKFKMKCQGKDCVAFLDDNNYCGLCDITHCSECCQEMTEDHICDKDTLETIKLIKNNSKPCPACGERISKIDGCDQMWCIMCKKAFSWRTGRLETGVIHNPEYFRWLRENETEAYQVPVEQNNCVFPDFRFLRLVFNNLIESNNERHIFENIFRRGLEFERSIDETNNQDENTERYLKRQRVFYLNKVISNEVWKQRIENVRKCNEKAQDIANVKLLLKTVILECLWKLVECYNNQNIDKNKTIEEIKDRLEKIRNFANESFKILASGKVHSCKKYTITDTWEFS